MTRHRRRGAAGTTGGATTGVATGALALLSAGGLATLGLLGAGGLADRSGSPDLAPLPRAVVPPATVVVTPSTPPGTPQPVPGPTTPPLFPVAPVFTVQPVAEPGAPGAPAPEPVPAAAPDPTLTPEPGGPVFAAAPQPAGTAQPVPVVERDDVDADRRGRGKGRGTATENAPGRRLGQFAHAAKQLAQHRPDADVAAEAPATPLPAPAAPSLPEVRPSIAPPGWPGAQGRGHARGHDESVPAAAEGHAAAGLGHEVPGNGNGNAYGLTGR